MKYSKIRTTRRTYKKKPKYRRKKYTTSKKKKYYPKKKYFKKKSSNKTKKVETFSCKFTRDVPFNNVTNKNVNVYPISLHHCISALTGSWNAEQGFYYQRDDQVGTPAAFNSPPLFLRFRIDYPQGLFKLQGIKTTLTFDTDSCKTLNINKSCALTTFHQITQTAYLANHNIIDEMYYGPMNNMEHVESFITEHGKKWCNIDLLKSNKGLKRKLYFRFSKYVKNTFHESPWIPVCQLTSSIGTPDCFYTQKLLQWGMGYPGNVTYTDFKEKTRPINPPQMIFIYGKGNNAFTNSTVLHVLSQDLKFYFKVKYRSLYFDRFVPHLEKKDDKEIEEEEEKDEETIITHKSNSPTKKIKKEINKMKL